VKKDREKKGGLASSLHNISYANQSEDPNCRRNATFNSPDQPALASDYLLAQWGRIHTVIEIQ